MESTFYESRTVAHWPASPSRERRGRSRRRRRFRSSAEVTFRPIMAARAQEVRSLPIGMSPASTAARATPHGEPLSADTDIRKSARDHRLANKLFELLSKNIRVRRRARAGRATRSRTREPLPRRGETDEGRPRRRRRRLRRTRTTTPVPFRGPAPRPERTGRRHLIITAPTRERQ